MLYLTYEDDDVGISILTFLPQVTSSHYSDMDKRLLGVFFYFREMAFKVLGGDLAERLLGVGMIWPKDSLVPGLSQHQGVFCPDHPNTKESFCQIKNPKNSNFKSAFWA